MNINDLNEIRHCPAYHFARALMTRQQPFRPVVAPNWPVNLEHLSHVIGLVYGARIDPQTWAVVFHDLGVEIKVARKGEILQALICESHTLDWVQQTWPQNAATDCYGAKFEHFSDMPNDTPTKVVRRAH